MSNPQKTTIVGEIRPNAPLEQDTSYASVIYNITVHD